MESMTVHWTNEQTHLEERVLVHGLELVRAKELETALGLGLGETLLVAQEEGKDVVEDDGLEIDLVLVVQTVGFKPNLSHIGLGVWSKYVNQVACIQIGTYK
jgi:hypothetical protein